MAKVIITFEDVEDGQVKVSMNFDPPADQNDPPTPAQGVAMVAVQAATNHCADDDGDLEFH